MGAFVGVSKLFKNKIVEYAKKAGYSEDNILILSGNETELAQKYPETYQNLLSCRHHADRRSPIDYGKDLVASWLFEDYLFDILKNHSDSFTVSLSGADKERKILARARTSSTSDYEIIYKDGTTRKMELMNDYSGYWAKNNCLDLRDSKYNKLKNEKALLLAIAVGEQKFSVIDFSHEIDSKFIANHRPYGFKPAYQIPIDSGSMIELESEKLINELAKYKE